MRLSAGGSMRRREFLGTIGVVTAWPMVGRAQQAATAPRVGFLYPGPKAVATARIDSILKGVRESGYAAPAQIEIVLRTTEGDPTRTAQLAAEILQARVDVLFAIGREVLDAFRSTTSTVPIVAMDLESDPVGSGMAESIAHPGGNITGVFFDFPGFTAKWLELLKEINPKLSRVAVLWDAATGSAQLNAIQTAALPLKIQIDIFEVRKQSEFVDAFVSARERSAGAMLMLSSPLISTNGQMLAELSSRYGLPAVTLFPDFARAGGLLAYGPNLLDMYRQSGIMMGKVMKGTKPADLPIERPTNFQIVLNLKTAKALEIPIPTSVLLRADEVIE
jgi:putative tryptophan/tyrosine transport system substrate-binding protein